MLTRDMCTTIIGLHLGHNSSGEGRDRDCPSTQVVSLHVEASLGLLAGHGDGRDGGGDGEKGGSGSEDDHFDDGGEESVGYVLC